MSESREANGDNMTPRIEPPAVIDLVEQYIDTELHQAEKSSNRMPLDDSGCWSLHRLAADIYARGHEDGQRTESERARREARRRRDAREKASE